MYVSANPRKVSKVDTMSEDSRKLTRRKIELQEVEKLKQLARKVSTNDFDALTELGAGSFGVVTLVRCKQTLNEFALKRIRKDGMSKKNHRERALAERKILSGFHNEWVVTLFYTFQDQDYLYLVMEYLPGGSLLSHMTGRHRFSESVTAFYTAELTEAVHSVHRLGFIHRDIKPENIMLTADGHLKLIDFGLCKFDATHQCFGSHSSCPRGKVDLRSSVGTPQYMAPEVLERTYDQACDYWSVGVIAFECITGKSPFRDQHEEPCTKYILDKVRNFRQHVKIPDPISVEAAHFLKNLICEAPRRMRYEEIRAHAFLSRVSWSRLRESKAPIQPGMVQTGCASPGLPLYKPEGIKKDPNMEFVGYTYTRVVESAPARPLSVIN